MSTLLSALECRPLQSSNADPVSPFTFSINMRGNYVESLRLSPDQPQLKAQIDVPMNMTLIDAGSPKVQQSQTQLESESRHSEIRVQSQQTNIGTPLRGKQSPTVNGWSNVVVKEEPQDEKNEDSGVSPSYYTSGSECSPNCRAPSTETDNSSPISAFVPSPESIQATNIYNYAMYNSSYAAETATPVATGGNKNKKFGKAKSAIGSQIVSSSSGKDEKDRSNCVDMAAEPLACPVCPYKTQNRVDFSEHLIVHSGRCDATEVKNSVLEQLTQSGSNSEYSSPQPTSNAQNENETDSQDTVIGMRVPRVNCQGKVKTHKCKQCGYIAITKLDFWEHTRSHIKDEKLLTCPKCPFVTEYKHHLEYHLRNHVGSKPYKCNQCDYSCVNKSMLNSHLKSHSNVYQFRCADCSYATKYCHSLKLHLRKYKHEPAMVLNADGSPNPLPIVDVYGTKRGPKTKPKKEDEEQQQQQQQRLQQGPPPQPDGLQHLQQLQQLQTLQQLHQQQLVQQAQVQQAQAQQAQAQIEPPQPSTAAPSDVNEQMTLLMHQAGLNRLPAVPQFPFLPLQAAALQSAALTNGLMPQFNMGLMNLLCTSLFNPFSLPNVFTLNNDNGNINQQQLEHMAHIRDSILDYIRKYGSANEAPEQDDQPLNCVSPSRYSADHNDNSQDQEDDGDQALDLTKA